MAISYFIAPLGRALGRATIIIIVINVLGLHSLAAASPAAVQFQGASNCSSLDAACGQHSPLSFRNKRQAAPACNKRQWRCRDGQCIPRTRLCDGEANCNDKSDELQAVCFSVVCSEHFFQCSYGACVQEDAKCNGVQECADGSDEFHMDCRPKRPTEPCGRRNFKCDNNQCIKMSQMCDGVTHCTDGSDETVRVCAGRGCPDYSHQCAYGACVDGDARCNNIIDCADRSDEDYVFCQGVAGYLSTTPAPPPTPPPPTTSPLQPGDCIAPEFPEFGSYVILAQKKSPPPGTVLPEFTTLQYSCKPSYQLSSPSDVIFCDSSQWTATPICQRKCKGHISTTVDLTCTSGIDGTQVPCNQSLPHRSTVVSVCKPEHFGSALRKLTCLDGDWDYPLPKCTQDCGQETSQGVALIVNGQKLKKGEFPWHVGLYTLGANLRWEQICGGSIVRNNYIITAAHCVWDNDNGLSYGAENYKVAVGKFYRDYYEETDAKKKHVQFFGITRIFTALRYGGEEQNQQEDMALLLLDKLINFSDSVRPVCLDYDDLKFDKAQISSGVFGKAAGWGLTSSAGSSSPELKTASLPVIDYNSCSTEMPQSFRRFLTSDKFCAGYTNGTALCQGDSGGGLVFSSAVHGVTRWYLRGIVSVAPTNETTGSCREDSYTAFTHVTKLGDWINGVLEDIRIQK